jgi:hypothetical protein
LLRNLDGQNYVIDCVKELNGIGYLRDQHSIGLVSPDSSKEILMTQKPASEHKCADCELRKKSEANPKSIIARLWRWHTKICPGWRSYQKALAAEKES